MPTVGLRLIVYTQHEIVSVLDFLFRGQLTPTMEVGGGTHLGWGFVESLIIHRLLIDCQTVLVSSKHLELGLGRQG